MQVTRRYWAGAGLASLLAVTALVYAQPLLMGGAAALGAWLLIQQVLFLKTVLHVNSDLQVTQSVARDRLLADNNTTVVVEATRPSALGSVPAEIDIEAELPPGLTQTDQSARQLRSEENTAEASTTFTVSVPVAGQFELDRPTVTVTDSQGLFQTMFPAPTAETPSITAIPRRPRDLHVGQGGDEVVSAFGDHKTGEFGLGLDPGEIREYMPGDTARQIDWKATARSASPHVREFEEESDRQTVVFLDHRHAMQTGPAGKTKLEYLRQVALAFVDNAQSNRDPIGLYTVGDEGITSRHPVATQPETYPQLETRLHDITPTRAPSQTDHSTAPSPPREVRQATNRLSATDSTFATRLQPYFDASQTYVQRITSQPLYKTVRTQLTTRETTVSAIVLTDDQYRGEVRETVKLARKHRGEVMVFLAPTVLFEQDGLTDIDHAYDRYTDFETFRRSLTRLDGVAAFEIAPGDRLDALLATQTAAQPTQ